MTYLAAGVVLALGALLLVGGALAVVAGLREHERPSLPHLLFMAIVSVGMAGEPPTEPCEGPQEAGPLSSAGAFDLRAVAE